MNLPHNITLKQLRQAFTLIIILYTCLSYNNLTSVIDNSKGQSFQPQNNLAYAYAFKTHNSKTILKPESYISIDYEQIGEELIRRETAGKLKIGRSAAKTIALYGQPDMKTTRELYASDAQFHQTWFYFHQGLELDLVGDNEQSQKINKITLKSPSTLGTKRHIAIGDSIAEVQRAYSKAIDSTQSTPSTVVAGSLNEGIVFEIIDGRVVEIIVGSVVE